MYQKLTKEMIEEVLLKLQKEEEGKDRRFVFSTFGTKEQVEDILNLIDKAMLDGLNNF